MDIELDMCMKSSSLSPCDPVFRDRERVRAQRWLWREKNALTSVEYLRDGFKSICIVIAQKFKASYNHICEHNHVVCNISARLCDRPRSRPLTLRTAELNSQWFHVWTVLNYIPITLTVPETYSHLATADIVKGWDWKSSVPGMCHRVFVSVRNRLMFELSISLSEKRRGILNWRIWDLIALDFVENIWKFYYYIVSKTLSTNGHKNFCIATQFNAGKLIKIFVKQCFISTFRHWSRSRWSTDNVTRTFSFKVSFTDVCLFILFFIFTLYFRKVSEIPDTESWTITWVSIVLSSSF